MSIFSYPGNDRALPGKWLRNAAFAILTAAALPLGGCINTSDITGSIGGGVQPLRQS